MTDPSTKSRKPKWLRIVIRVAIALVLLAVPVAVLGWYRLFRDVPQPDWITDNPETNFLHGSVGAERQAGLPYWIVVVLPRIFDDLLPGPGGYASLGLPWQEGSELPAGFTKKKIGFDRVGFNCALCHTTQYRTHPDETATIVAAGPNHTADLQGLLDFFNRAANDSRFSAETIMAQIDMAYPLDFIDRLLYKFLFIPLTKKKLAEQGADFGWTAELPRWGPGRDAAVNLAKFGLLRLPLDSTVDNTDFPSIWGLRTRVRPERMWPADDFSLTADLSNFAIPQNRLMLLQLDGATTSFRSVILDSALGIRADNSKFFRQRVQDLEEWLLNLSGPKYPLPIDSALVARGAPVFEQHCASCHANNRDNRLGTVIPLEEVGTDPERVIAWTRAAADSLNRIVRNRLGVQRTPMVKPPPGYIALQLDGLWLRGPYLHNGSVPTVRALLEPEARRPTTFYRGYDVLDHDNMGYISRRCAGDYAELPEATSADEVQWGCMPRHRGWLYDTRERGNSNRGHRYGIDLPADMKTALLEYLKTL